MNIRKGVHIRWKKYEALHDLSKTRRQHTNSENAWTEEFLANVLDKVEGSDMMLHDMRSGKVLRNESLDDKFGDRKVIADHAPPKKWVDPKVDDIENDPKANDRDGDVTAPTI
ncbi:hypothetical protein R3W88_033162 [Solanum pinnatisectum]|uniref:Uncharacterized protein n=1 Tax=Solanum pinnatisectum TaxID=50273 RepID=A0AAV9K436_9SOLN|nr:hypothetical protein R3W88_033162 [Solanum pinnatisectum]